MRQMRKQISVFNSVKLSDNVQQNILDWISWKKRRYLD